MDVTGGLADAVNKIKAALLSQAQAAIQSEIDRMEADGEKLVTAISVALDRATAQLANEFQMALNRLDGATVTATIKLASDHSEPKTSA
jgi:hypothetical protein